MARQLADQLVGNAKVRFLTEPFPLELEFLKSLQVHLERERLTQRLEFACTLDPKAFQPEAAALLAKMNFNEIALPLDFETPNFEALQSVFNACEAFRFQVTLFMQGDPDRAQQRTLQELYFFLYNHLGKFELIYQSGYFEQVHEDMRMRKLAQLSKHTHLCQRFEHYMQEQIYIGLYEFLRMKLSNKVKTVLEINPYAQRAYFQNYNRLPYPWKVTLSSLDNHKLNHQHLQELGKTFDAVVLFQTLPHLSSPKKELLHLQQYTRSTTEWACSQYNLRSMPILAQLVQSKFSNAHLLSGSWDILSPMGKKQLDDCFDFTGVSFDWVPTRIQIEELKGLQESLDGIFKAELPDEWQAFLEEAFVFNWAGYGTVQLDESDAPSVEEGFVSEGFL